MVPAPWARGAAAQYRGEDVGVGLTLNAEHDLYRWGPITQAPSLLDGDGGFPRTAADLWDHADLDEVRRECRAQLERAIYWGFDVSHLDAHLDAVQLKPEFFDVFLDLADEFRLPLRLPDAGAQRLAGFPFRELAAERGVLSPDRVILGARPTGVGGAAGSIGVGAPAPAPAGRRQPTTTAQESTQSSWSCSPTSSRESPRSRSGPRSTPWSSGQRLPIGRAHRRPQAARGRSGGCAGSGGSRRGAPRLPRPSRAHAIVLIVPIRVEGPGGRAAERPGENWGHQKRRALLTNPWVDSVPVGPDSDHRAPAWPGR